MDAATIYAPATGSGRAGVAILRVSGPAAPHVPAHFGAPLPHARHAAHVTFRAGSDGEEIDRGLLLFFPAPHSFTGEDVVELHAHGSPAVLRVLMQHLAALPDTRLAQPGEFTRRAYLNGKMDLTAAEGLADLIQAESDAQRRQALRQLSGANRDLFETLRARILGQLALLEACIDFSDEEIPPGLPERINRETGALQEEIGQHLSGWHAGERVREGWQVVILGLPNAGKSTLLNALTRREAALVSPHAGTTRDVIETTRLMHGHAVILMDTAGLREAEDSVERMGIARAHAKAGEADMRMVVIPAGDRLHPTLAALPPQSLDAPTLVVWTKTDLASMQPDEDFALDWEQCGVNLNMEYPDLRQIEQWITQTIENRMAGNGTPLVTRIRHREAMAAAQTQLTGFLEANRYGHGIELQCEHLRMAAQSIGSITGTYTPDDVLGLIFNEFCIGK